MSICDGVRTLWGRAWEDAAKYIKEINEALDSFDIFQLKINIYFFICIYNLTEKERKGKEKKY